jgi:hypothetical protein
MGCDKSYSNEQAIAAMRPGPQTAFNPLNAGWSVLPPYTGAWVTFMPAGNRVQIDLLASIKGASAGQVADGYQIAVIPGTDAAGNILLPQQTVTVCMFTDALQSSTPGAPRLKVQANGSVLIFGISTSGTVAGCCESYPLNSM